MTEGEAQRLSRIKANLQRRALICEFTRAFFRRRGFLEVETPVRVPAIAPELNIVPFESESWFLSTSPELYMKRLLAAGYTRIFQMAHCFRKGERGRRHNPEFTLLEWYRAGADYRQMVRDTEQLVITLVNRLKLAPVIRYQGQKIDLTPPWPVSTVHDAFMRLAGWDPVSDPDPLRFDVDLVTKVIPAFDSRRPVVLLDYPAPMASLARLKPHEPEIAERVEIFAGGLELANAYSELTNSREQEIRFYDEAEQIERERGQRMAISRQFLDAVKQLPESGGIALGMDRLVMLLCDANSIDDVLAFSIDSA